MPSTDNKAESVKREIDRLRSTNPVYDQQMKLWKYYLAAYEGGPAFATKDNLHRHPRENEDDFAERSKRIHYMNYCRPLVEFFTDFTYGETIQRNGGKEKKFFNTFTTNVNNKGDDVTAFMKKASNWFQIFGECYGIVDTPVNNTGRMLTKAEEEARGIRPYWVLCRPEEILDWATDEFGGYLYIKRRQLLTEMVGTSKLPIEKYTEWTKSQIKITLVDVSGEKPQIIKRDELDNALGVVPVEKLSFMESLDDPDVSLSFLRDIADQNREVMNLTSLLQEFLYRQCFNILAMEDDPNMSQSEQNQGEVGTANMLRYPKGSTKPEYITPSAEPADKLQEERQKIIGEMYRVASQDMVNDLFNGGKSSGMSKAMSFSTTVPKIAARADKLQRFENAMFKLTFAYMSKEWDGAIKYKDRYEITNLSDAITQLTSLFRDLALPSETAAKEELKRLFSEFDGRVSAETMDKIYAEIDKELEGEGFNKWLEKVAQKGAPSPAAQNKPKTTGTMQEVMSESTKQPIPAAAKKQRKAHNAK